MWRGIFDNRSASFTWCPLFHPNDMCFRVKLLLPLFQNKSYIWWSFSQTSPNEPECCQKQCKCCCWWITKSNNNLLLFNNWYLDSTASAHINSVLCAPMPSTQNGRLPMKLVPKVLDFIMDTPARWKALSESYAMHVISCWKCKKWP